MKMHEIKDEEKQAVNGGSAMDGMAGNLSGMMSDFADRVNPMSNSSTAGPGQDTGAQTSHLGDTGAQMEGGTPHYIK